MNNLNIVFAGTPEFSVPILEALIAAKMNVVAVYTQPDKVSGRGQHLHQSPVKQCALQHNIPVEQPISLRNIEAQERLASLKPDIMIVVAYGLILPQVVLDIPTYGCLNIHASLLPRWRGASPIQQAILAGDAETGVCLMKMEAGLDTGPVYAKKTCAILSSDTAEILHDRLSLLGAEVLMETLSSIVSEKNPLIPQTQDTQNACYAGKITKQAGLIDWNQTAIEIDCKVRAYNPWPVAYFYMGEEYIRVWQGEAIASQTSELPGTVLVANSEGIHIAAGQNTIFRIIKLQCANAKAMSVRDYLNAKKKVNPFSSLINE